MPCRSLARLSLAAALAGGCTAEAPISARAGELSLCLDLEGELPPECLQLLDSSTGAGSSTTFGDLPHPGTTTGDPTHPWTTTGGPIDPSTTLDTHGTSHVDAGDSNPTYPDPSTTSWGPSPGTSFGGTGSGDATQGTGSGDATQGTGSGDATQGPGSGDATQGTDSGDATGTDSGDATQGTGSGDATQGTTQGATSGAETGGTTGGWSGSDDDGGGDDVTGEAPNPCSARCSFPPGGGLPAMVGPGSKLPFVEGCAERGVPNRPPTRVIVTCLANLACHLGRDPTKAEALEALGVGGEKSMLGANVIFSASSASGQPVVDATSDKPEGIRSLRAITAPFFEGAPWCSFTTLTDDATLECMNLGFVGAETCGTEPVGFKLDELCETIDATTAVPAGAAVFQELAATGVDGGQQSCSVCHAEMGVKAANGKDCYFFPISGMTPLCPTSALKARCVGTTDTPSCIDNSPPRCPSNTQSEGAVATCQDGADALCPGPVNAFCVVDPGVFGALQSIPVDIAVDSNFCETMKQIKKNAAKELQQGPSPPWTNTSFIDTYLAKFCKYSQP